MHFDERDNFLCQIEGHKRVVMFPYEDRDLLYMFNPLPLYLTNMIKRSISNNEEHVMILDDTIPEHTEELYFSQSYIKTVNNYFNELYNLKKIPKPIFEFKPLELNIEIIKTRTFIGPIRNSPVTVIWILDGDGILFVSSKTFNIEKGNIITFPSTYVYPWSVGGDYIKIGYM